MEIKGKITDWQLRSERPGKRTWMRYNAGTDEIEIMEEWFEEVPLANAKLERDILEHSGGKRSATIAPVCIIPDSVRAKSIKEGWHDDDKAWKRWMNDIDNRYLRITTGNV